MSISKNLARIFFCFIPALISGGLFALFDLKSGIIIGIFVFAFGWDVTRAKPERGEQP